MKNLTLDFSLKPPIDGDCMNDMVNGLTKLENLQIVELTGVQYTHDAIAFNKLFLTISAA